MQAQLQVLCLTNALITLTYAEAGAPTTYKDKPNKYQVKQSKDEEFFSFGCDCGYYKNDFLEKEECMELNKREAQKKQISNAEVNTTDGRIVNGYDVDKNCMPRPWLVYIRIKEIGSASRYASCGGSIINKKFIISAAHCFCDKRFGKCIKNDSRRGRRMSSGHYKWIKGKKKISSSVDRSVINRTTVISPGYLQSYKVQDMLDAQALAERNPKSVFKVKNIIIHPYYIHKERDQQDFALIETIRPFDFSDKEKISPICLPAPETRDTGIEVAVSGWGNLFEQSSDRKTAECYTSRGGPEEFKECRDWFIQNGQGESTEKGCITNRAQPSADQKECKMLHSQIPSTKNILAKVEVQGKKTVSCYPLKTGHPGWCAVCTSKKTAKKGQPGYCDRAFVSQSFDDVDYDDDHPDDVSADRAWGYCDNMCHKSTKDTQATVLQEVLLYSLKPKEALRKTRIYKKSSSHLRFIPQVDRELAVAKRHVNTVVTYRLKNGKFEKTPKIQKSLVWGGSDSCQGDSGGPMYVFNKKRKKAVLLGVVSRGKGCARRSALGIYTRVKYHMIWLKRKANSGSCSI